MVEKYQDPPSKDAPDHIYFDEAKRAEFKKYFPQGEITAIAQKDIPKGIIKVATEKSLDHLRSPGIDLTKGELIFYQITHQGGGRSYIIMDKAIEEMRPEFGNDLAGVVYDIDEKGKYVVGHAYISKGTFGGSLEEPLILIVGYTETYGNSGRQGLGARRIRLMHALCRMQYGKTLHSGASFWHESAENFWKRATETGETEKRQVKNTVRYAFKEK